MSHFASDLVRVRPVRQVGDRIPGKMGGRQGLRRREIRSRVCRDCGGRRAPTWRVRLRRHGAFGCVDVVDTDVGMQLLRVLGIRPAWWDPRRCALERQLSCAGLNANDYPVLVVLLDAHAQDLRVERCERAWIRTVQYGLLQSANHDSILMGTVEHLKRGAASRGRGAWLPVRFGWMIERCRSLDGVRRVVTDAGDGSGSDGAGGLVPAIRAARIPIAAVMRA